MELASKLSTLDLLTIYLESRVAKQATAENGAVIQRHLDAVREIVADVQQRDELLAALKNMREDVGNHLRRTGISVGEYNRWGEMWNCLAAAIAKAQGRSNEFTKGGGLSCEGGPAAAATEETGIDRPAAPTSLADPCPLRARYDGDWYFCWLIERRDHAQPLWFTADCTWTQDANEAMWHARKSDADTCAGEMFDIDVVVCEHGFALSIDQRVTIKPSCSRCGGPLPVPRLMGTTVCDRCGP